MWPRPVLMVCSRRPQNMKAKKPPTSSSAATPPPTMMRVIKVRRLLRKIFRNASSRNLATANSFGRVLGDDLSVAEANDALGVFEQARVVRREDEGKTEAAVEPVHEVDKLGGVVRVQVGGRL